MTSLSPTGPRTLVVDIGGTGTKMIVADEDGTALTERRRALTPKPATPKTVLQVCERLVAELPAYDRVAVGFPGVVTHGIVRTAPNLSTPAWAGFDLTAALQALTQRPVRVLNDADLQGFGVIDGRGVELVLTLGTGLGAALYTDGHLVPNLELGHHPLRKGKTYEERVSDDERKRIGKDRWAKRVYEALDVMVPVFNPERLWIGGGNASRLDPERLPAIARRFDNVEGMAGGVRVWELEA